MSAALRERVGNMVGREEAGQDRVMRPFVSRQIDEARGTADQHAAREGEFRHRLPAAFADRARPIRKTRAAAEDRGDLGMGLEALKFVEGRQRRVAIIEMDDEADRDAILVEMIEETAAATLIVERPADKMRDVARTMFIWL